MDSVTLHGKPFHIYLEEKDIQRRIAELATAITRRYEGQEPLFVAVLNGSFMFAADLMKSIAFPCHIQFVKVSSYSGLESSGKVQELIGLTENVENRPLVVLEDIIDSGLTMDYLRKQLLQLNPSSLEICTLLLKPLALKVDLPVAYTGFEVENQFLVGYGLDYDGLGRNLRHIYQATETDNA